jgi:predicted Holliday junction resolvase-like endonuclease
MTIQDILSIGLFSIVVYVGLSFAVLSLYLWDEVKSLRKNIELQKKYIKMTIRRRDKNVK